MFYITLLQPIIIGIEQSLSRSKGYLLGYFKLEIDVIELVGYP
jgi:hypothetical protein